MDKNIRLLALRDAVCDILSEYKSNPREVLPPRVWLELSSERILQAVAEGWLPRSVAPGSCDVADFSPFIFVHCPDGKIKLQYGYGDRLPFVYVNYCAGCGAKSPVPVEEIST